MSEPAMSRASVISLVGILALFPSPASAAYQHWETQANCPAPTQPEAATSGDAPDPGASQTSVQIVQRGALWHATIRAVYAGGVGERSLVAASCEELLAAVQLALSLLAGGDADPLASADASEDLAGSVSFPDVAPQPPAAPTNALAATSSSAPRPRAPGAQRPPTPVHNSTPLPKPAASESSLSAYLVGLVNTGAFDWVALGGALGGRWSRGAWGIGLQLDGQAVPGRLVARDIELTLQQGAAWLDVCHSWPGRISLDLCAAGNLELLAARAPKLSGARLATAVTPGVGAKVGVRFAIDRTWALQLAARGSLRLRSVHLNVEPWGSIYQLPQSTVGLQFGPEFTF